jgi:hypothetical protein
VGPDQSRTATPRGRRDHSSGAKTKQKVGPNQVDTAIQAAAAPAGELTLRRQAADCSSNRACRLLRRGWRRMLRCCPRGGDGLLTPARPGAALARS